MSLLGFLPQRWRTQPGDPHRAEDLVAVLETAPIAPSPGGPVICARIGSLQLLPFLVACKSLHQRLGRGRAVVIDDGSLTGSDRTILAHHLGDPAIEPRGGIPLSGFPSAGGWEPILAALDGRGGAYWLVLDPHCVALAPVPEIASAIAGNRSLHGPGLMGLAAGGAGRPEAAAFLAALGNRKASIAELLMVREAAPVALPSDRYRANPAQKDLGDCALAAFGKSGVRAAAAHAAASRTALAALGGESATKRA